MELQTEKFLPNADLDSGDVHCLATESDEHPLIYVHERCGGATEMPDTIRYKYMADPCFFYSFLGSHCAKCGGGVPDSQLHWAETGESLSDYARRIKWSKPRSYHLIRWLMPTSVAFLFTMMGLISLSQKGESVSLISAAIVFTIWTAIVWWPLRYVRLMLCFLKVI